MSASHSKLTLGSEKRGGRGPHVRRYLDDVSELATAENTCHTPPVGVCSDLSKLPSKLPSKLRKLTEPPVGGRPEYLTNEYTIYSEQDPSAPWKRRYDAIPFWVL